MWIVKKKKRIILFLQKLILFGSIIITRDGKIFCGVLYDNIQNHILNFVIHIYNKFVIKYFIYFFPPKKIFDFKLLEESNHYRRWGQVKQEQEYVCMRDGWGGQAA